MKNAVASKTSTPICRFLDALAAQNEKAITLAWMALTTEEREKVCATLLCLLRSLALLVLAIWTYRVM